MKRKSFALSILLVLSLGLTACISEESIQATDLMEGVTPAVSSPQSNNGLPLTGEAKDAEPGSLAVTDFSVRLFQKSMEEGKNTLLSPLSVLCALSMTANGAGGETLAQMEDVFGLSIPELNEYLHTYTQALPQGETYKLTMANSIWIKDDGSIQVKEDFLKTNAAWYEAGVYQAPFDNSTAKDINNWISQNTDGLIQNMLEEIPSDIVMYLINALVFDAEWQNVYFDYQVGDAVFTTETGVEQEIELMHSNERIYLEDEQAVGMMKPYADGAYSFVALLPKEGIPLSEYVASLTGEKLRTLLSQAENVKVETAIPKFQSEYEAALSALLQTMGMTDAFDPDRADLSGIGTTSIGPLYISQVLHKTFITVDERGTEAGAATIVAVGEGAEAPSEVKTVRLDRPFFYMIVDREAGLPVFMGTVADMAQ